MPTTFNIDADFTRVAMLSHTKFVVVYRANVSSEAFAAVGTVSGGTISFSGFVSMDPGPVSGSLDDSFAVVALDSGHALAVWSGSGTGAWAAVLTVAGSNITAGPRNQFSAADADWIDAIPLAGGRALIAFRQNVAPGSYRGVALVATVAGSDITFGAAWAFNGPNSAGAAWVSASPLPTPGRVAIAYVDGSLVGKVLVATVVGTGVSFGASTPFQIGEPEANVTVLSLGGPQLFPNGAGERLVVTYKNGRGYARVGTVSYAAGPGATIALGPPREFYSGSDLYATRTKLLGPDKAVLFSRIGNASANTCVDRLMTFSGDAITFGSPTTSVLDTVDYLDLGAEENGTVVVVYARHTPNNDGQAIQLGQYESAVTLPPLHGKFSDDASYSAVARLSSTKFVVVWRGNDADGNRARVAVGTLSGTDITFGASAVVDAQPTGGDASSFAVVGLDATHALAVWGGISPARAAVLTVAGTSVAAGSPANFAAVASDWMNAVVLSTGKVLIVFRAGGAGKAVRATVSGTDVTFGATATIPVGAVTELRAAALSPTKAVVAFTDASPASKALIAAVSSAGAVTFGAPYEFQNGQAFAFTSLMKLDDHGENFAVAYAHGKGYIKVGTLTGTGMGIAFGQPTQFYANTDLHDASIARLNAGHGALVTREGAGDGAGKDRLVTMAAPIDVDPPGTWFATAENGVPTFLGTAALDDENVIVVYCDSLSGDGLAVLRQYAYVTPSTTEPPTGTPTIVGSNLANCRAAKLSSTKFAVVYVDPGNNYKPYAAVGEFNGVDVEFGPPKAMDTQWATSLNSPCAVVRLDNSRALAVWKIYQGDPDRVRACVLTKHGALGIDVGPPVTVYTGIGNRALQYSNAVLLSPGKVLLVFSRNGAVLGDPTPLTAVVATVSGNAITVGAFHNLAGSNSVFTVSAAALSATKAVIAFWDLGSSPAREGRAVVATVSGTDVTFGPVAAFVPGSVSSVFHASVLKLDAGGSRFAVAYSTGGDGAVRVGTVSGAAIAFGSAWPFAAPAGDLYGTRLSLLSPDNASLTCVAYVVGPSGTDMQVAFAGDAAAFGTPRTWYTGTTLSDRPVWNDLVAMDPQDAIAFFVHGVTKDIMPALLTYGPPPPFPEDPPVPPYDDGVGPVGSGSPPPGGESPPTPLPATTTTTTAPPAATKWEQPPDPTDRGVDVRACSLVGGSFPVVLASDWPCAQRGELAGAWLWCSYLADALPPGGLAAPFLGLRLSIHSDVPLGPWGHSCPGDLLWEHYFVPGVDCVMVPHATVPGGEWFWDPTSQDPPAPMPAADSTIFRVDCDMTAPGVPRFVQEGTAGDPRVYWLDAQAFLDPAGPPVRFGWKTTPVPWNDAAVFSAVAAPSPTDWHAMAYPPPHPLASAPADLAFGLSFRALPEPPTLTSTTAPPATTSTTGPPVTTTTTNPQIPHPADTGPGTPDFACTPFEVLAWANTWLQGGVLSFLNTPLTGPGVAQAYILRAAAITLANFQARYQDGGTVDPVNSTAHPQRWLETPDI